MRQRKGVHGAGFHPGSSGGGFGVGVVKSGGGSFTQDRIIIGAADGKLTEDSQIRVGTANDEILLGSGANLLTLHTGGAAQINFGGGLIAEVGGAQDAWISFVGDILMRPGTATKWRFLAASPFQLVPEADNAQSIGSITQAVKALIQGAAGRRQQAIADGTAQSGAGATVTLATSPTLDDNANTLVGAYVSGGKSDESEGAGYYLMADYRRTGGGAPQLCGAVVAIFTGETDATANATLAISGNTIIVQGTSPAGDTYDWYASIDLVRRT